MTVLNVALYDALLDAGAADQKAHAAATSVPPTSELVTEADIAQMETRLRRSIRIGYYVVMGGGGVATFLILFLLS